MLQLHDRMKEDEDYQATNQVAQAFPPAAPGSSSPIRFRTPPCPAFINSSIRLRTGGSSGQQTNRALQVPEGFGAAKAGVRVTRFRASPVPAKLTTIACKDHPILSQDRQRPAFDPLLHD